MALKNSFIAESLVIVLIISLVISVDIQPVRASPGTIRVPIDYPTIQAAVYAANPGDVIYVYSGVYYEHVFVNKTVSLIGENRSSTIVDGSGSGSAFSVLENYVLITGFTARNSSIGDGTSGFYLSNVQGCSIVKNDIVSNGFGVKLRYCYNNIISGNAVTSSDTGIYIDHGGVNTVLENTIANNYYAGIDLFSSGNNSIHHNDFFNNSYQVITNDVFDFWDAGYPTGGNHWTDYGGIDANNDGIGDTPYIIDGTNRDNYPLMEPYDAGSTRYPWPMFHSDLRHAGYSEGSGPKTSQTLWSYQTFSYVHSSPAVADKRVFVGSDDGCVYCLDALTGTSLWNHSTSNAVYSSPAIADGRVYVGSDDGNMYCLDASTGLLLWNYPTGNTSCPAVANGRVYVGSRDRNVYCLNALTGTRIWNYSTGGAVYSSPAIADGRVYVGSTDGHVYCLNASTGTSLWNYPTSGPVFSSPAIVDGRVYVGSYDSNIYCLDAWTGTYIWNYPIGSAVFSSPAVADGRVYVGSTNRNVYCLDALTGAHIWNYLTGSSVWSSPAVADGRVYVGSDDGNIYCLDAFAGSSLWSYPTVAPMFSSPAIADGVLFIGSGNGRLYALGRVLKVPEDFRTIQGAINAANPGDTISIAPSVYHEQLIINKPLTILGRIGTSPIFGGGGSGTAVTIQSGGSGTTIAGIVITNYNNGILISGASNCKIYGNIMSSMVSNGVAIEGSSAINNNIYNNIFQDNFNGISLVSSSTSNIFCNNVVASNDNVGINVESNGNAIYSNTIMENPLGMRIAASGNTIYHNNFLNNPTQAATLTTAPNAWDNGYPSGGNYWSDYTGQDVKSGLNQDVPGSDAIGDTARTVSQNNIDRYPWVKVFNPHDIGIAAICPTKNMVAEGYSVRIEIRILNHGMHDETFNLICNANSALVGMQVVTLLKREGGTRTVVWNTIGFARGDYSINAYAGPALDETELTDNFLADGTVKITHLGDITGDGKVDIQDVARVSAGFGSLRINDPQNPRYGQYWHQVQCVTCPHTPNADVTGDDKIDIQDLARTSANFGWHE